MSEQPAPPHPSWQADSTDPETAAKIRQALRLVADPELGLSIIELGLVRDVSIGDQGVVIKMILTTPFCPYGPALLESARSKAQEASGREARIELSMEMWEPGMMEEGLAARWGLV